MLLGCLTETVCHSQFEKGGRFMVLEEIKTATISGKIADVEAGVIRALDEGIEPSEIVDNALISAMGVVGEQFKNNEIFVPEMLIAAKSMQAGLKIIEPLILSGERKFVGKAVIGTVQGDLHDIGKNLVIMMLNGSGWDVVDLGVDVAPDKFIAAIKEHNPQLVGLSALLTTTMPVMRTTIEAFVEAGVRDSIKIFVGGAPVSGKFADEIGADGYAPDAGAAIEIALQLGS